MLVDHLNTIFIYQFLDPYMQMPTTYPLLDIYMFIQQMFI